MYLNPTVLLLAIDLITRGQIRENDRNAFAWLLLRKLELMYLCNKNLKNNINLHILHIDSKLTTLINNSLRSFVI